MDSDLPAVMRIERECFPERPFSENVVRVFLTRADAFLLVAEEQGDVVGAAMCLYSACAGEGKIASVAVLEEHRRKGIGSALLKECESLLESMDIHRFSLEVGVGNTAALELYSSRGYKVLGILRRFYSDGQDAYCMEKVSTATRGLTDEKV